MSEKMRVERIDNEGDRILFYGSQPDYRVIGSPQKAAHVNVGDVILYEPYDWNFGWFESLLAPAEAERAVSTDSEDENWPFLVADILGAVTRLEKAKAAVVDAEEDLATCVRVLKGLIGGEGMKAARETPPTREE